MFGFKPGEFFADSAIGVGGSEIVDAVLRDHVNVGIAATYTQLVSRAEKLFDPCIYLLITLHCRWCFLGDSEDSDELVRSGVQRT